VAGVEPASESTLTGLSPGADGYSGSLPPCSPSRRQAVTLAWSGKSHGAWAGQLFPASRTPHKRRLPRPVASPVQTAALIRQQQQQCCCYLIYNCPFYGGQAPPPACPASIPPSKPVHPRRRGKLRSARFRLRRKLTTLRCPSSSARNGFAWFLAEYGDCWSWVFAIWNCNILPGGSMLQFHEI